jgi:hypothetical protein
LSITHSTGSIGLHESGLIGWVTISHSHLCYDPMAPRQPGARRDAYVRPVTDQPRFHCSYQPCFLAKCHSLRAISLQSQDDQMNMPLWSNFTPFCLLPLVHRKRQSSTITLVMTSRSRR